MKRHLICKYLLHLGFDIGEVGDRLRSKTKTSKQPWISEGHRPAAATIWLDLFPATLLSWKLYYDNRLAVHGLTTAVDVLSVPASSKAPQAMATASWESEFLGNLLAEPKPLNVCSDPIENVSVIFTCAFPIRHRHHHQWKHRSLFQSPSHSRHSLHVGCVHTHISSVDIDVIQET